MEEISITKTCEVLSPQKNAELEALKPEFKGHRCVANARLVCRKLGYKCVEGFILAVIDGVYDMRYCRHCWNVTEDGKHFDVTAEFCFPKQPDEIHYSVMGIYTESDYEILEKVDPSRVFCSKAVCHAAELNCLFDIEELKKLEKAVFERGKELGEITDEFLKEQNPVELDKKLLELRDKDEKCKDAFSRYKKKLHETIDSLTGDLTSGNKQLFQSVINDIISDTSTDTTRSRLQKLVDLKNSVLPYLK